MVCGSVCVPPTWFGLSAGAVVVADPPMPNAALVVVEPDGVVVDDVEVEADEPSGADVDVVEEVDEADGEAFEHALAVITSRTTPVSAGAIRRHRLVVTFDLRTATPRFGRALGARQTGDRTDCGRGCLAR